MKNYNTNLNEIKLSFNNFSESFFDLQELEDDFDDLLESQRKMGRGRSSSDSDFEYYA